MKRLKVNNWSRILMASLMSDTETGLDWSGDSERNILWVRNIFNQEGTLTIKAGNGIQGKDDLVLSVPGKVSDSFVRLESGKFKNVTGPFKGKIVVKSTLNLNIQVFGV
nr:MAG TPA: hypothetical protein [Caudoviricetes sp.]